MMATIVPAPVGSGNIARNFALAGGQLGQGLGQFLAQQRQQQKQKQLQQALRQFGQQQGLQIPANLPPQFLQQLLLNQQKLQATKVPTAAQQIKQNQLNRQNLLIQKSQQGTITPEEKKELSRSLQVNRPLIEFGKAPASAQFLTPEERIEKAQQPLKKPLSSTEVKGVDITVNTILGEPKVLPFGLKRGAAVSQKSMDALWEQTMRETGYEGRGKVAKGQIASRFDRRVRELNKGKGIGVLANQYQWNRKTYNATHRKPNETIDEFIKRTGL